jgi:hypothetical protein
MIDTTIGLGLFVSIVMAAVQVVKSLGLPKKFWPLSSIIFGIATNVGIGTLGSTLGEKLLFGVMIGAIAGGFWDLAKPPVEATVKKLKTLSFPK